MGWDGGGDGVMKGQGKKGTHLQYTREIFVVREVFQSEDSLDRASFGFVVRGCIPNTTITYSMSVTSMHGGIAKVCRA